MLPWEIPGKVRGNSGNLTRTGEWAPSVFDVTLCTFDVTQVTG